ncbi:MAG: DUF2019 domain-containing protein [Xanthobacteraceae bacterium]|nr:MAG: DUF2019 domain-containing protein [Xanthobacteraceae bacterium]
MSIDQLIARFAELGVAQDNALLGNEIGRFNRLMDQMRTIVDELKGRLGDQRHALCALYDHKNVQVRLQSARLSLAVAPIDARKIIEAIATSQQYPQAGHARMTLWNLDRGVFKPT